MTEMECFQVEEFSDGTMARSKNRKCESCLSMIKVNDVSIKCKNVACKKTWHSSCAEKTFNVDLNDIVSSFRWTCPECRGTRCKQKLEEITEKNLKGSSVWTDDKVSGDNRSDISNLDSKVLLSMLVADQKDSQKVLLVLTTLMKELLQEKSQMKNLCEENEELRKAMITHLLQDKIQLKQICEENESLKKKIMEMNERMQKIEKNVNKAERSHDDLVDDSLDCESPHIASSHVSEAPTCKPNTPLTDENSKQEEIENKVEQRDEQKNLDCNVCTACVHVNKNPWNNVKHVSKVHVSKCFIKSDDPCLDKPTSKESEKDSKHSSELSRTTEIQSSNTTRSTRYEKHEDPAVFPTNVSSYEPADSSAAEKPCNSNVVKSPSSSNKKGLDSGKRVEICVGRIAKGTPADLVSKYILKKIPKCKFTCEVMNPNGFYANFKVSVEPEYKDRLLSNAFWPQNVIVRRLYPRK
ncbi:uncharacterized protein LOC106669411 isoform X2 [Cimex lectularius]|uniref:PHD-type domain-containing protein n=1 Tax=Cimex lectularius TaxID=79782 RepID=A0A8I6S1S4_CIMLE|nr:uncharacterized protein LOC106669411 isoform X2 [Cimex lectularius]